MRKRGLPSQAHAAAMFHVKPFSPAPLTHIARAPMFHVKHFCVKAIADFAPHLTAPAQSVGEPHRPGLSLAVEGDAVGGGACESARRAVELDDTDHVTHLILGRIHLYRRDYALAERHLTRAEALNPNDADMLVQLALAWSYLGESERAQRLADLAMRLNPLHDNWYYMFMLPASIVRRRFRDVVAMGLRCLDEATDTPAYVAAAYAHLGELDEARRHVEGYLGYFQRRITYGRPPRPGEALDWLKLVNPYRRPTDLDLLLDGVTKAGLSAPVPIRDFRRQARSALASAKS